MRVVRHLAFAVVAAVAAASVAAPARGASAFTLESAGASAQAIAQISCPDGAKAREIPGYSVSESAGKLFFDDEFPASMDASKAECAGTTPVSARANAKLYASANEKRLRSKATLESGIVTADDATKDRFLDAQGIANLDWSVTAEVAASYNVQATLTVARGEGTSTRGSLSFEAGNFSTDLNAGGTNAETVTLSKAGTVDAGDEISISLFALAACEPGGLTSSRASWKVEITLTPTGSTTPPAPGGRVTGTVRFEKPASSSRGLDYSTFTQEPAAGVRVEAVDDNGTAVATTRTDELGRYELSFSGSGQVRVRVSAVMDKYEVRRLGGSDDLYTMESAPFVPAPTGTTVQDVLAVDDLDNGALNLLFVARKCEDLVRTAEPGAEVKALRFRWFPGAEVTAGTAYSPGDGVNPDEIFVAGRRPVDSDVFDDVCVAHEVGHFFMRHFGRNDSPGGSHGAKQSLDPRLAWSEGWATFFGCAAFDTSLFRNTAENGTLPATRTFDIEQNRVPRAFFGPTGEMTVASALWDVFDARADAGDRLALGFTPMWDALRETKRDRFVYLGDYFRRLHLADPAAGPALRGILKAHGVRLRPGSAPDFAQPFPTPLPSGKRVSGVADSTLPDASRGSHSLSTSSFLYEIVLTQPGEVTADLDWRGTSSAPDDLDLFLLNADGGVVAGSESHDPGDDTESIATGSAKKLPAGTYVVEVASAQQTGNRTFVYNRGRFRLRVVY